MRAGLGRPRQCRRPGPYPEAAVARNDGSVVAVGAPWLWEEAQGFLSYRPGDLVATEAGAYSWGLVARQGEGCVSEGQRGGQLGQWVRSPHSSTGLAGAHPPRTQQLPLPRPPFPLPSPCPKVKVRGYRLTAFLEGLEVPVIGLRGHSQGAGAGEGLLEVRGRGQGGRAGLLAKGRWWV